MDLTIYFYSQFSILIFFQHGQGDGKLGALPYFTLNLNVTLMQVDDLLNVSQSKSEALDVVLVACVDTVELIKDLLDVFFLDAHAGIADGQAEVFVLVVPGAQVNVERLIGFAVFHRIVHQIGDGILEMHLIDVDSGVDGFYLRIDLAASMLYTGHRQR